jgi:putative glutathione S-transferase
MGYLLNGSWTAGEPPAETDVHGQYARSQSKFRDTITADGSSGFAAEAGRYHLYVSHGCPWAHRTLMFHALKRLDGIVTVSHAIPGARPDGWRFANEPSFPDCEADTVNGFHYLREAYIASNPLYTGKVTVPTLWDRKSGRIINNESSEIIRMFNKAFNEVTGHSTDYYPKDLRPAIDSVNAQIYRDINNGVYRCGFASSQKAYEEAFDALFNCLDDLEARLGRHRYLVGQEITEADWRLFATLVRFDLVYFTLFKCNKQRISEYSNLSNYMRELYQIPGIAATVKPRYIVMNYYGIQRANPNGIIPKGTPTDFDRAHDRERLAA